MFPNTKIFPGIFITKTKIFLNSLLFSWKGKRREWEGNGEGNGKDRKGKGKGGEKERENDSIGNGTGEQEAEEKNLNEKRHGTKHFRKDFHDKFRQKERQFLDISKIHFCKHLKWVIFSNNFAKKAFDFKSLDDTVSACTSSYQTEVVNLSFQQ